MEGGQLSDAWVAMAYEGTEMAILNGKDFMGIRTGHLRRENTKLGSERRGRPLPISNCAFSMPPPDLISIKET
jgi:hypothetical protein